MVLHYFGYKVHENVDSEAWTIILTVIEGYFFVLLKKLEALYYQIVFNLHMVVFRFFFGFEFGRNI